VNERILKFVHHGSFHFAILVGVVAPVLLGFGFLSIEQASFALVSAVVIVILSGIIRFTNQAAMSLT
jgi:hypothetical protein